MSYNKSKKGIAYPALMSMFLIVLFLQLMLFVINPMKDVKYETDFGTMITQVDNLIMLKPAEDFYKKTEVDRVLAKSRQTFIESIMLGTNSVLTSKEDNSKLLVCKLTENSNTLNLWLNEIALNEIYLQEDYSDCIPDFGNVDLEYLDFLKKNLGNELNENGVKYNSQIAISKTNEDNLDISVENSLSKSGIYFSSDSSTNFNIKAEVNSFSIMLETIQNILPDLSENFKEGVPICVRDEELSEIECINKVFNNLVKTKNTEVAKNYNFKLSYFDKDDINSKTDNKYYGLKIAVSTLGSTSQDDLSFGVILKDTIPYTSINFEVETSTSLDNFVNVLIQKPSFSEEVENYLIMYSYQDFLSSGNLNSEFVQSLQNGEVPLKMLTTTSLTDTKSNQYYYSNTLGISVMLSSKENFESIEGKEGMYKTVPIFQIYNSQASKFELINKQIYVYVFALDKNYNLFVNNIENNAKAVVSSSSINGPIPPTKDKVTVSGALTGHQNMINVIIKNYVEVNFDHFDIYILDKKVNKEVKLTSRCTESGEGCYYFNGDGILTKDKFSDSGTFNYVITSDENSNFANTVLTNQFSSNFDLVNGNSYDVYIIPCDSNNVGSLKAFSTRDYVIKDADLNFVYLDSTSIPHSILNYEGVKIEDKKAPTIEDVKIDGWNFKNNVLYLQWSSIEQNDIKSLTSQITIYGNDGTILETKSVTISIDGKVVSWQDKYNRIELKGLTILDNKGNNNYVDNFNMIYPQTS